MRGAAVAFVLFVLGNVGCAERDADREGAIIVVPFDEAGRRDAVGSEIGEPGYADTSQPTCAYPQVYCVNRCIDVSRDTMNCGACNAMCPAGHSCNSGLCVPPPPTQP